MMLKRLNFLKNSLDGHSPRQTTEVLRHKSVNRRDQRLVDIWKKEYEHPSVKEIIGEYIQNKGDTHTRNSINDYGYSTQTPDAARSKGEMSKTLANESVFLTQHSVATKNEPPVMSSTQGSNGRNAFKNVAKLESMASKIKNSKFVNITD